ncbi:dTDP-glucose pyrophosphorylase [Methanomicrobium sp. W14]|uniref:nucleotidyltransferase family protein n=1 Tax=Methanomicrobium sp. W14 TaxID=2817839 RepID=UPI001AE53FA1|nr:nucleotidyltransferase family protein [Methanomicrobium sp. W14]MBP2134443.1 dTDP-glucose pyrophosphorylase [Methanomicrobium sp. W14]
MKALILAGGRGKRLGDLTSQINKCMIQVGKKPVIEHSLMRVTEIPEISEVIIVVGHRAEDIINHFGISYNGKKIQYVIQWEQLGLVNAIECAKDAIGSDDFLLLLGDEIFINSRHKEMVQTYVKDCPFAMCGVFVQKDLEKISRTYTVLSDENGRIFRLIEKPKKPLNHIQGTGNCVFRNEILSYIKRTPIHPERGEKELPDLIQCAIDDGNEVSIFNICDNYGNINTVCDRDEIEIIIH